MDVLLIETGNGGDLVLRGNDLVMNKGMMNMPYLGMFGGNVKAVTKEKLKTEQSFDWWGNELLMPQDESIQFNSLLEKAFMEIPLTSSGRIKIEQVVKKTLAFMNDFAEVFVKVDIIATDKVKIFIRLTQPKNLSGRLDDIYKDFVFIWDATLGTVFGDFSIEDFNDDFYV